MVTKDHVPIWTALQNTWATPSLRVRVQGYTQPQECALRPDTFQVPGRHLNTLPYVLKIRQLLPKSVMDRAGAQGRPYFTAGRFEQRRHSTKFFLSVKIQQNSQVMRCHFLKVSIFLLLCMLQPVIQEHLRASSVIKAGVCDEKGQDSSWVVAMAFFRTTIDYK